VSTADRWGLKVDRSVSWFHCYRTRSARFLLC